MRLVDEMNLAAAFRRQKERLDCKNDCEFEPNVNIWFFFKMNRALLLTSHGKMKNDG